MLADTISGGEATAQADRMSPDRQQGRDPAGEPIQAGPTPRVGIERHGYSWLMTQNRIPDSHLDLLDAEFATLATVGADGYPQLSEVWFLAEAGQIAVSLNSARQKTKNLEAEPACTLLILDLANPYRYVEIRGTADVVPDADLEFARKVGAKYDTDLREHDAPGDRRVVARIIPVRVRAVDMRG